VPVREPIIVPVREPIIVPVLEPIMVPVREPIMVPVLEPIMVPVRELAKDVAVKAKVMNVAKEILLRVMLNSPNVNDSGLAYVQISSGMPSGKSKDGAITLTISMVYAESKSDNTHI
jgi:hypothetical protein